MTNVITLEPYRQASRRSSRVPADIHNCPRVDHGGTEEPRSFPPQDALIESVREALARELANPRDDEPGEAAARLAEFQKLSVPQQRTARLVHYILRTMPR